MSIMNHGSNYLSDNDQSHMYIAYHKGFETICQRIRAKYPEVTIQACASGGGRVNYGLLPYFDEFWVSDNTDALQRVICNGEHLIFSRQLPGFSYQRISQSSDFPSYSIKISHRCGHEWGVWGMEIQPQDMTTEEKEHL